MTWLERPPRPLIWRLFGFAVLAGLAAAILGASAVATNAFGVGDRFEHLRDRIELALFPPPDRPTRPTIVVTPPPIATASPTPATTVGPSAPVEPTVAPTPQPTPVRRPVDLNLFPNSQGLFAHEIDPEWCAPAGVQMVLAMHGVGDVSSRFQRELQSRVREWEAWSDSHNGKWGPAAMSLALEAYGVSGYEIHAYDSRGAALHGAAAAITTTRAPVILLAWRGAHTWVMSGYRANADPSVFPDAVVSGAYIYDPWYPDVSSIWGRSDPPGAFQNAAEMQRNFLRWARPEGHYPDRDGKYIMLIPTIPLG